MPGAVFYSPTVMKLMRLRWFSDAQRIEDFRGVKLAPQWIADERRNAVVKTTWRDTVRRTNRQDREKRMHQAMADKQ